MKNFFLFFLALFCSSAYAQKETFNSMDAEGLNSIVISSDEIFKITVTTAPVDFITYKTKSGGEYFDQINLDARVQGESLFLTSRFREILQSGYDKLSAHKVFSMEVVLEIPENFSLDITSNLTSVYASGNFENVLIQLKSGSCYLKDFSADAIVNTFNGNIELSAPDAEVTANSRHGKVSLPEDNSGSHKIALTSINGNIWVVKTK